MTTQLRPDQVDSQRKLRAGKQKFICPICRGSLAYSSALDHSHKNGQIRSVLCTSCNVGEGKVLAGLLFRTPKSNLAYSNPVEWLRNLARYIEYHEAHPSGVYHPTFDMAKGKQKTVKRKSVTKPKPKLFKVIKK
jgi:hypothetical protein